MINALVYLLAQHGVQAYRDGDGIRALSVYTINGKGGSEWVTLPAKRSAVLAFLGY